MKWFIGIILFIVLWLFVCIYYGETYKMNGKIIDIGITSSRDGNIAYYHTLVQYDDGSTEDLTGTNNYIKLEKGVRYTFTRCRLNFHKK
jgi:hypothetical protein